MATSVRELMVQGAVGLLARRGLQSTSFSEVLAATGAPRGSVYHHFPQGKDQMVGAAVDMAGAFLLDALERKAGATAPEITAHFLAIWRAVLTRAGCSAGCAVLAVTVATDAPDLLAHATAVFRSWRSRLAELLVRGGLPADAAPAFATLLIASVEGAVVLSRAEQDPAPFEAVAQQLQAQVERLASASAPTSARRR